MLNFPTFSVAIHNPAGKITSIRRWIDVELRRRSDVELRLKTQIGSTSFYDVETTSQNDVGKKRCFDVETTTIINVEMTINIKKVLVQKASYFDYKILYFILNTNINTSSLYNYRMNGILWPY